MDSLDRLRHLTSKLAADPYASVEEMFQTATSLLCIAGGDGFFKKVSPSWTLVTGWTEKELTAQPWIDFIHPADVFKTERAHADMLNGYPAANFVNRYRCKDGSYKTLLWNTPPVSPGGVTYASAVDVTELAKIFS